MSYQNPSKRQKSDTQMPQGSGYGEAAVSNRDGVSNAMQLLGYAAAPSAELPSGNGSNNNFLGSVSNTGNLQPNHDHQQLISELLTAAMRGSGSPIATQQSGVPNSAQLLLSQLQAMVGNSQGPNELLLQQLQQLIQPQQLLSIPSGANNEITTTQSSLESDQPGEADERKSPAVGDQNLSQTAANSLDDGPLSAIVPCRARGMPPDHNASSAYFVVPHNVKHGSNLYCSFPACRNEGIKFCYCSHCGIPVAKRNFRQRHDHASKKKKQDNTKEGKATSDLKDLATTGQGPATCSTERKLPNKQEFQSSRSPGNNGEEPENGDKRAPMKSFSFQRNGKNVSSESEEIDLSKQNEERKLRWASLLRQRPRDVSGDEMSAWLLSVLEVSNVKKTMPGMLTRKEVREMNGDDMGAGTETPSSGNGSEQSEESTFGSEGVSSDSSEYRSAEASSQNEDSSSDSNTYSNFVNQSQLVERGVVKTESGIVSAYGVSTESSGPTDQSGGVDTTSGTNDPSTSGSGTNSMGGSSSDSENGSNNELGESIPEDRKRPSIKEELPQTHRPPVKKRKQNAAG